MAIQREVVLELLPGEPKDGSGRIRIHWFCRSGNGPITTIAPLARTGRIFEGMIPATGYIACQPHLKTANPTIDRQGRIHVLQHTDEPSAVTCPECRNTAAWTALMGQQGREIPPDDPVRARAMEDEAFGISETAPAR